MSEISLDYLKRKLAEQRTKLEIAKVTNKQVDRLKLQQSKLGELEEKLRQYRLSLLKLKTAVIHENNFYMKRRIEYLNQVITQALAEIFPFKNLEAKIDFDYKKRNIASLDLIDGSGISENPYMCEGKLMQYLISFAAVAGITEAMGVNNLYIDEAFGASSISNLSKIGDIIKAKVMNGMQLVIIAQNSVLYEELPRREIHLERDHVEQKVIINKVIDY